MKFYTRKAVMADLTDYCHLAKPHTHVEVTEWANGEGWDISLGERTFTLTVGELNAVHVLCSVPHPRSFKHD